MNLLRRTRLLAALVLAAACASSTEPGSLKADPSLDLASAHTRWLAVHPSSYTAEISVAGSMLPPAGYVRVTVINGTVTDARLVSNGTPVDLTTAPTVDGVWASLLQAQAMHEPITDAQFTSDGIPIHAMRGTFANDGGVAYAIRSFVAKSSAAP